MLAEFLKATLEALLGFFLDRKAKVEADLALEEKGAAKSAVEASAQATGKADEMAQVAARDSDRVRTLGRLRDGSF